MIKNIPFSGLSSVPSDYECPDGHLAASTNLIAEDGAIHPILPPLPLREFPESESVVHIHKTAEIYHLIVRRVSPQETSYLWYDNSSPDDLHPLPDAVFSIASVHAIKSIGNVIVMLTSEGLRYWLWGSHNNPDNYISLGSHLPHCDLSFGLQAAVKNNDSWTSFTVDDMGSSYSDRGILSIPANYRESATNAVIGQANELLAKANKSGKFIFPFLVRYAYRLYDGSHVMASAPVLMIPSSGSGIHVGYKSIVREHGGSEGGYKFSFYGVRSFAPFADLDFQLISNNVEEINRWSDVIKSVDIFVSAPIITYAQDGEKIEKFWYWGTEDSISDYWRQTYLDFVGRESYSVSRLSNQNPAFSTAKYPDYYGFRDISTMANLALKEAESDVLSCMGALFLLPQKSKDAVKAEISDCANFYLLESVSLDKLNEASSSRVVAKVMEGMLSVITQRERLQTDALGRDSISAQICAEYNNRLSIADISKVFSHGQQPNSLFPFTNGYVNMAAVNDDYVNANDPCGSTLPYRLFVFANRQGKEMVLDCGGVQEPATRTNGRCNFSPLYADYDSSSQVNYNPFNPFLYFFFPNPDAYKAVILPNIPALGLAQQYAYVLPLQQHDFLNGAFFFDGWKSPTPQLLPDSDYDKIASALGRVSDSDTDYLANRCPDYSASFPNLVYTSDVDNPFRFPADKVNSIGSGNVRGLCSAARPLSQGQFGQFPLYAFCSDGIWSIEIDSTGSYVARQPISRDVCLNPDSITQLDSSVLFAADRGILLISGSSVTPVSEPIRSKFPFQLNSLPALAEISDLVPELPDFPEFLKSARMAYDYANQRVHVFNPDLRFAFVFSLRSQMWGLEKSSLSFPINSYPDSLAMCRVESPDNPPKNVLVDLADSSALSARSLLVSRPIKFDSPGILKTARTAITRGHFRNTHVKSILYGSRDLFHWHIVGSSSVHRLSGFSGSPFKFFRVALICDLAPDESISSTEFEVFPRLTNRLR